MQRLAFFVLLLVVLAGCRPQLGGSSPVAESPNAGPEGDPGDEPADPAPVAQTITLKRGVGFECLIADESLWCRDIVGLAHGSIPPLSSNFSRVASGPILNFTTWDDTVCFDADVSTQPVSRGAGRATYCLGEAFINGPATLAVVYSGPPFSIASHGAPEISFAASVVPFAGADFSLDHWVNQTVHSFVLTPDTTASVSSEAVSCSATADDIECPSFTIEL